MSTTIESRNFSNAAHGYSYDEVAGKISDRSGKNPVEIRCQALLVIGTFEDGKTKVYRIEDLMN